MAKTVNYGHKLWMLPFKIFILRARTVKIKCVKICKYCTFKGLQFSVSYTAADLRDQGA